MGTYIILLTSTLHTNEGDHYLLNISKGGYRYMKKLNLAIIGQGRSGRDIHGKYFLTDPDRFKVVAVVEALEDRRNRAAEEYGCDTYENYQELFGRSDIDLVVNASFSH